MIRITIDGLRDEFSFGYKVLNDDWDDEAKRLLTSDSNHKLINKKIGQSQTDIERHFDLMQAKHSIAIPQAVKESYLTPVNGADLHNQRMENLQLSESIDEMIFSYIAYCNKIEKESKDGRKPPAEKQELLQIEKVELKKAIEKLAKKATVIFEDENRQKTFILAVDEYLLHFMETGGESAYDPADDKYTTNHYGLGINTERYEGFAKIGYVFTEKKYKSISLQLSAIDHTQNSYFGLTRYDAKQQNFYSNLIYQSIVAIQRINSKQG